MKNKPPCVFDTNSLISALLIKTSVSRKAFDKALDYWQLLISDETVSEFEDVAGRERPRTFVENFPPDNEAL
jgi:predicted nucleic acid-binding protein